jgi:hypothetical protein
MVYLNKSEPKSRWTICFEPSRTEMSRFRRVLPPCIRWGSAENWRRISALASICHKSQVFDLVDDMKFDSTVSRPHCGQVILRFVSSRVRRAAAANSPGTSAQKTADCSGTAGPDV